MRRAGAAVAVIVQLLCMEHQHISQAEKNALIAHQCTATQCDELRSGSLAATCLPSPQCHTLHHLTCWACSWRRVCEVEYARLKAAAAAAQRLAVCIWAARHAAPAHLLAAALVSLASGWQGCNSWWGAQQGHCKRGDQAAAAAAAIAAATGLRAAAAAGSWAADWRGLAAAAMPRHEGQRQLQGGGGEVQLHKTTGLCIQALHATVSFLMFTL